MFFNREIVNPEFESVERLQFHQNDDDDDDQIFQFEPAQTLQQIQSPREIKITPRVYSSQNLKILNENNLEFYEPGLKYDEKIRKVELQKQINLIKQIIDRNQPQLNLDLTIEYPQLSQEKQEKVNQTTKPQINDNFETPQEDIVMDDVPSKDEIIFFKDNEEYKDNEIIIVSSERNQSPQKQSIQNLFFKKDLIYDGEEIVVEQSNRKQSDDQTNENLQSENNQEPQEEIDVWPFPPNLDNKFIPQDPDMKRIFLTTPIPEGFNLQCFITRPKNGLSRIYPIYHLYMTQSKLHLLSAKKLALNSSSKYVISMAKDKFSTKSNTYLGKLSSNFMGTEFLMWDNGLTPKKTKNTMCLRCQLGCVYYASCHKAGPRRMRVLIPRVDPESGIAKQFMPFNSSEGIQYDWDNDKRDYIDLFVNKSPSWNKSLKAYELDFYGRVEKPSVKNFQLIKLKNRQKLYFQFGRITDDEFNLDFTWPFSPLQAIQICISSFDFKFACE